MHILSIWAPDLLRPYAYYNIQAMERGQLRSVRLPSRDEIESAYRLSIAIATNMQVAD